MKILQVGQIRKQGLYDPDKFPYPVIGILAMFMAMTMWMRLEDVCYHKQMDHKEDQNGLDRSAS